MMHPRIRLARARGLACALAAAGVLAPAGCHYAFPSPTRSGTFHCVPNHGDCITGFSCVNDRCVATGQDGGTGGSGTVSIADCAKTVSLSPPRTVAGIGSPVLVYLPAGTQATTAAIDGHAGKVQLIASQTVPGAVTFDVPKDVPTGNLAVRIEPGSGVPCYGTTLDVRPDAGPVAMQVDAQTVAENTPTQVALHFADAILAPSDALTAFAVGSGGTEWLPDVTYQDPRTAWVTAPLAVGSYTVWLVADGKVAGTTVARSAAGALTVAPKDVRPVITAVAPMHLPAGGTVMLSLTGANLASGEAVLVCGTSGAVVTEGPVKVIPGSTSVSFQTSLALTVPAAGQHCTVEVTTMPPSSPKLTAAWGGLVTASLAATPAAPMAWSSQPSVTLAQPRYDAGAAVARLPDGRRYLVVAGGLTDQGSGPTLVPDVEVRRLDAYGVPGPATSAKSSAVNALVLPAVAAFGSTVYMVGGARNLPGDAQGPNPRTSIYTARILGPGARVQGVTAHPTFQGSAGVAGGSWYYAVTAVLPSGSLVQETPASVLIEVTIPGGVASPVEVGWTTLKGASTYNIYRGPTPADVKFLTSTTTGPYTDRQAASPGHGPAPPVIGSLSTWTPESERLATARYGAAAVVLPGTPPQLVVAGGDDSGKAPLDDAEVFPINDQTGEVSSGGTTLSGFLGTARGRLQGRLLETGWSPDGPSVAWTVFGPGVGSTAVVPDVDAWRPDGTASGVHHSGGDAGASLTDPVLFLRGSMAEILDDAPAGPAAYDMNLEIASNVALDTAFQTEGASYPAPVFQGTGTASAQEGGDCYLVGGETGSATAVGTIQHAVR